jgi:hypothetical protein
MTRWRGTVNWEFILLTKWNGVPHENLVNFQRVKKFSAFYGARIVIIFSQEPTTGPYPDPVEAVDIIFV